MYVKVSRQMHGYGTFGDAPLPLHNYFSDLFSKNIFGIKKMFSFLPVSFVLRQVTRKERIGGKVVCLHSWKVTFLAGGMSEDAPMMSV